MRVLVLFLCISIFLLHAEGPEKPEKEFGYLNKTYLCHGNLDAVLVCKHLFPSMTPEQINESLRDIRRFVETFVKTAAQNNLKKVGEKFLTDILHVYGHIITFIETAWVDRKTKRVFVIKGQEWARNADPLLDYWWHLESTKGIRLHCDKFYASCIDHLTIMIRAYLLFPCYDDNQASEMDARWLWWLEKVTCKLLESPIYGGYYKENVKLFREVYALWHGDFKKKRELKQQAFARDDHDYYYD